MTSRSQFFCVLILRITLAALCHHLCAASSPPQPGDRLLATIQAAQAAVEQPLGREDVIWQADSQSTDGRVWRYLRGHVEIHKEQMILTANEVDYNEQTHDAYARGNVHFVNPLRKEDIYAARFDYNLDSEIGMFYQVHGKVSSATQGNPFVLHTSEPFYFQGETAQKIQDHYIVYHGFITDCKVPHPWWTLGTPRATIVPGSYALMRRAVFRLRKIPLFYAPVYYKSLERLPRQSGFLTPNIGNSSSRGRVLGESFFWAISRSFDLTLDGMYYSARGPAEQIIGRGRPNDKSHFDAYFFAVQDRGIGPTRHKQGGQMFSLSGRTELPWGFHGAVNVNYLSSLEFRLAFTETLNEAIFSEAHSVAFATKSFSTFFIDAALVRTENFFTTQPSDHIVIRKLPSLEFNSREHELLSGPLPVWFSLDSAADFLDRGQPNFHVHLSERFDLFPRVSTGFSWKGFHFTPTFGLHETHYGEQQTPSGTVLDRNLLRSAQEVSLELVPPSLERIFNGPKLLGDKLKHVIEPKITYRYVTGVDNFNQVIRFDERDLLTDTNEVEFSLINRLYSKRESSGEVREILDVEVRQWRYFDPTFGGALVPGQRNVFLSTVDLTPFAFADTLRSYSPIVSVIRVQPRWNYTVEWRNDYDPLRGKFVDSGISADATVKNFGFSLGHFVVRSDPLLTPPSNQLRWMVRYGAMNKRGWNTGFNIVYDYRQRAIQYANSQVTYNTDCCGFSVEFRRFALGSTRNDNQFRLALSIANIGSFGNLKKQEKMF
ncbi:MAG TPA: LPS assembly protein LptD [Bryobacterales bacterium]|nr:LPS assembly protein LptD [Bryobacterales bacterium]